MYKLLAFIFLSVWAAGFEANEEFLTELQNVFEGYDMDKNQLLTKEEIINGIQQEINAVDEPMNQIIDVVEKLYTKHDIDGNGVDLNEFLKMAQDAPNEQEL